MNSSILITGSTGTLGSSLYQQLAKSGETVIAGARNTVAAQRKLGADALIRAFDFADPSTFENATKDVNRVFIVGPALNLELDQLLAPFLDFLKDRGILRVVYISALGLDKIPELPFHTLIEQKLAADGFEFTILRPSFFAQNFKNFDWENITERGIIYTAGGNGKAGFIAVEDITAVAATVLTEPGHLKKIYELTGPELLSYYDVAALLTEFTGKEVVYPNPDVNEFRSVLMAAGAPAFVGEYMSNVYGLIRNNHVDYLTDNVLEITGRNPTPLREVLKRDFSQVTV